MSGMQRYAAPSYEAPPVSSNHSSSPRPNKFKDSCDSCAQSKVKCNRVRPSCRRCIRNGIACHYSLARRGKAGMMLAAASPRRVRSPPLPSVSKTQEPQNHGSEGACSPIDLGFIDADFCIPTTDFVSSLAFDTEGITNGAGAQHGLTHDSSLIDFPFSTLSQWDNDMASDIRHTSVLHRHSPSLDMHAALVTPPLDASDPFQCAPPLSNVFNEAPQHSNTSIQTVLSTLESLHQSARSCARLSAIDGQDDTEECSNDDSKTTGPSAASTSTPMPGIDSILKVNNMAIANIATLLKCPCTLNEPGIVLLALICCNSVMDAYQRIPLVQQNLIDADRECGNANGPSRCPAGGATAAVDMPVAVGAYVLDGNAKRKMISSLLLSELAKLGNVLEKMSVGEQGTAAKTHINSSNELVSTLKSFLKTRLRATVRAVSIEMADFQDL